MTRNKIIGLTGGIGSGKTSVAQILGNRGDCIIDADKIAHQIILKGNPAYDEILQFFDKGIIGEDGEISRKRLGGIVFADDEKRQKLMEITHKYITREMLDRLYKAIESGIEYHRIVLDAPLLIEAGLDKHTDEVWLVCASQDVRIARIMERDGVTEAQALLRIRAQTSTEILKKYASKILENNGDLLELEQKVNVLCY